MATRIKLSASLICANLLNLEKDLSILRQGGFDYIHFDMMDGHFVPRIGLDAFFLRQIASGQPMPVDVHLMVTDPVRYYETGQDIYRTIHCIRNRDMKAGIALRPFTPLSHIEPFIDYLDMILLMAYSPGTTGQSPIRDFEGRVAALTELLGQRGREHIDIAVDGGVSEESISKLAKKGATFFVFGTSGLFMPGRKLDEQIDRIQQIIKRL
jgi:ribulose-phosphate 3-epimerase